MEVVRLKFNSIPFSLELNKREHFEAPTPDTNGLIGVKLNYKILSCKVITEVRGSGGSREVVSY